MAPTAGGPSPFDYWFSSQQDVGEAYAAIASDGSLWRLRKAPAAGGPVLQIALDHAVLQAGLATSGPVDIDAAAFDAAGDLFLSFRDDELIEGDLTPIGDGAIVGFAAGDISWNPDGTIASLGSGTAQVVLEESDTNAFLIAAGLLDDLGSPVLSISDLQALDVDPAGGTFLGADGVTSWPNLLFCGSTNGPRVLTTAAGGAIALLNSVPLGDAASPIGSHLGLDGNGNNLTALQVIAARDLPLCLDLSGQGLTPLDLDDTLWIDHGAADATVWLFASLGPFTAGANFDAIALADKFRFQSWYSWNYLLLLPLDLDAAGRAQLDFTLDPADLGADLNIVVQVAELKKPVEMSAPIVITYDH